MIKTFIYPLILLYGLAVHVLLMRTNVLASEYLPMVTFVFFVLPIVVILEKIIPSKREWLEDGGELKKDIFLTLVLLPVLTFIIKEALLVLNKSFDVYSLEKNWGFWGQFFIAFTLSEFLFYWYHRFSHKNQFLRKYHSFHHNVKKVYWANSGSFHVLDTVLQFSFYFLPIFLLRVSMDVASLILSLSAITGVLEHSNIDYRSGFFRYFFNTVDLHQKHHSSLPKEANTNFGKVTIVFDLIFKTYLK